MLGYPIKGHVTAARAGHASNVEFVKKLKKHYSKELEALKKDKNNESIQKIKQSLILMTLSKFSHIGILLF